MQPPIIRSKSVRLARALRATLGYVPKAIPIELDGHSGVRFFINKPLYERQRQKAESILGELPHEFVVNPGQRASVLVDYSPD